MTGNLLLLPVAIPAVCALGIVMLRGHRALTQAVALAGGGAMLLAGLLLVWLTADGTVLTLRFGGWEPHVGITWVCDAFSAIMLVLSALASLAMVISLPGALAAGEHDGLRPLHQALLVGVNASFLTGDLFNLFVCFELMLLASFALLALGGGKQRLRAALPYVIVNLIASLLLLAGVGAVYGTIGTVNLAELSLRVAEAPAAFWAPMGLVLAVFAIKAALAPVFVWLPDAYPVAPLPVSALFAGLLTKVGVYALFRVVPLLAEGAVPLNTILLPIAVATMVIGVIGALGRDTVREILSFHIVSQVGYMVLGLAIGTRAGLAAGVFYLVHHIVVKTALFLAGGVVERCGGGRLGAVAGLAHARPWLGVAFLLPALALAGMPPLSGFWGKLFLVLAGFEASAWIATAAAVAVSLLTLASMLKIWNAAFWGASTPGAAAPIARPMLAAALALAALSLAIGLLAPLLLGHCERIAEQLATGTAYRAAVLGSGAP